MSCSHTMSKPSEELYPLDAVVRCGWRSCAEIANLKACSRCKNQWYCSVDHQSKHWKTHKPLCKQVPAASVATSVPATPTKPAHINDNGVEDTAREIQRFTIQDMPECIESIYALRKEITIRHGYNMMDQTVQEFFKAMKSDCYPMHESEGLFGIQMEPAYERYEDTTRVSLGNLVYLVWLAMWKYKFPKHDAWRNEIVMMILMGKLPEWLQLEIMEYSQSKEGQQNNYVNELLRRGLDNITYDILLYRYRWGEITEKDIKFLTKTA